MGRRSGPALSQLLLWTFTTEWIVYFPFCHMCLCVILYVFMCVCSGCMCVCLISGVYCMNLCGVVGLGPYLHVLVLSPFLVELLSPIGMGPPLVFPSPPF